MFIKLFEEYHNTLNDNFWRWFDNSIMINTDKTPQIYYHGSIKKFKKFDYSKISDDYINNILGFYFTTNKNIAAMYGDNIYTCYLNLKNPIKLSDTDFQIHLNYSTEDELKDIKENYIKQGYDGIDYGSIIVVFYPNQIKSIENDGTFDLNDDNIYS